MESEVFYGKIWKTGDGLVITVPRNIIKFGGYSEGDGVKIMMQKATEEKKEED